MTNARPSRRQCLSFFASAGVAAVASRAIGQAGGQPAQARPPNILFIMTDDHAAHAVSCYGSKINVTPSLDRLAREGMKFENAFVTNALCGPSRATLLTGKYSHANGFMTNSAQDRFDGRQQTFIKMLKGAGYQTAVIGKWHLNSDPVGFDHWDILPGQGRYKDPVFLTNGRRNVVQGYVTDVITDKCIDWIKKRDQTRPFCLLYHHKAPHREWEPDTRHAKLYDDREIPQPETFNDDYATRGRAAKSTEMTIENDLTRTDTKGDPPVGLSGAELKNWKYQRYIKDYLRCVASVDDNVGRMLDFLDEQGMADNTIVVYTSDNGFFLGDHGWYDKRFMYEHSLKVPLIVRYPGKVKPGTVSKELVINCDYGPTFLDYAGIKPPADMHGRSLRPILENAGKGPADWRKSAYYHYYEFPRPHRVHPHYALRTDRYKIIHFYTHNDWELFDLEKDPNELKNLNQAPENSEIRDKMTA
jgi:arylsulfatase A-like enzyme